AAGARAVEMTVHAKPCGFRTYLGNRFAIPTFPPPRRLLDSFHTKSRKELSSAIPSGLLQAHSSIRKDCPSPWNRSLEVVEGLFVCYSLHRCTTDTPTCRPASWP